jgi:hypothetical protein
VDAAGSELQLDLCSDGELQLDLRGDKNESDKFDSIGRYVNSFASSLDSMAANMNRVAVKSNRRRV